MGVHSSRNAGALGAISVDDHKRIPPDVKLFLQGKKILIVQDEQAYITTRTCYCIERGAEKKDISVAGDYETAINALDRNKFDVIILDMGFFMNSSELGMRYSSLAGLYVLEHIVLHNMEGVILIDSSGVGKDLNTIYEDINRSPNEYPSLARLGKLALGAFLGIFPKRDFRNPTDNHFIELLQLRRLL